MQGYNVIAVFNKTSDKLLLCLRRKNPYKGLSNFVGGKIEKGETGIEAAYRELSEETAISKADIILTHLMSLNPHAKPVCITCFRGSEIHFLHIGDGMNKSNMSVDPEGCVCLTSSDIDSVKTGLGKKVTLTLKDGGKLIFAYGVGAGTIYSLPDGDKQLEQFLKFFT